MTEVEKDILIKDLCARLDTNLVCSIYRVDDYGVGYRDEILSGYCKGDNWREFYFGDDCGIGIDDVSKIKPYLIPLSSMTEEQKRDLTKLFNCTVVITKWEIVFPNYYDSNMDNWNKVFNWCYKNNFDCNGLISSGLAIDATNLNIYDTRI